MTARRGGRWPRGRLAPAGLVLIGGLLLPVPSGAAPGAEQEETAPTPTVWDGVFTDAQADRGRAEYRAHCAECHGIQLGGGEGRALVGPPFWDRWRESTVDRVFDFISANMPYEAGALPLDTYVDLVAFLLRRNGLPAGETALTTGSLRGIPIIAEDGPGELPNSTLAHVTGCLTDAGADGWVVTHGSPPVRAEGLAPDARPGLGDRIYPLLFVLDPLDRYVGSRVGVTGLLVGDGGAQGLNVMTVERLGVCQLAGG